MKCCQQIQNHKDRVIGDTTDTIALGVCECVCVCGAGVSRYVLGTSTGCIQVFMRFALPKTILLIYLAVGLALQCTGLSLDK